MKQGTSSAPARGAQEFAANGRMCVGDTNCGAFVGFVSRRWLNNNHLRAIPSDAFLGLTSLDQL